jgi:rhomboid protease GluP
MLVVSMHFPPGGLRTGLQMNAIYVLIPSLLPLASGLQGHMVDYAAHFGGAISGVIVGFVMLRVWSQTEASPGFWQAAAAIAVAGVIALAYPAMSIPPNYQAAAFTAQLIPSDKLPKTAEMRARAVELIAQYPHDPRPRFLRAADLLDANDPVGAEREARAGLAEEDAWRSILSAQVGNGLRVMLAIAINGDRRAEALSTARPVCTSIKDGPMRKLLDAQKLCGT